MFARARNLCGVTILSGLVLATVMGLVAPSAASAQDLDAAQRHRLYYRVKPSVVHVRWKAEARVEVEGRTVEVGTGAIGSGYVISPDGFIVTNGHVVEDYHNGSDNQLRANLITLALEQAGIFQGVDERTKQILIWAYLPRQLRDGLSLPHELVTILDQAQQQRRVNPARFVSGPNRLLEVVLQNGKAFPAELKEYSPPMSSVPGKLMLPQQWLQREAGKDVAVLKIAGRDLPTVALGNSDRAELGATVHVAGFPGVVFNMAQLGSDTQLEASFTPGQIASLKSDVQGYPVIQHTAPTTGGNSGGPVFNDRGEVVGMHTLGHSAQGIQGFNFAVPVNVVREFVRAAGIELGQRSVFDRTWERALDDYFAGRHQAAMTEFDMALRLLPALPDAERLRRASIEGIDILQQELAVTGPDPIQALEEPVSQVAAPLSQTTEPTDSSTPWIVGGLVLLSLVLIPVGLVMRRRNGARIEPALASPPDPLRIPDKAVGHLVVRSGPLKGNRFSVPLQGITIGRDPAKCQMVLGEESVSREHALIIPAGAGSAVALRNLSHTNPTYINDKPIQEQTLRHGDLIKVGDSVITFEQS